MSTQPIFLLLKFGTIFILPYKVALSVISCKLYNYGQQLMFALWKLYYEWPTFYIRICQHHKYEVPPGKFHYESFNASYNIKQTGIINNYLFLILWVGRCYSLSSDL